LLAPGRLFIHDDNWKNLIDTKQTKSVFDVDKVFKEKDSQKYLLPIFSYVKITKSLVRFHRTHYTLEKKSCFCMRGLQKPTIDKNTNISRFFVFLRVFLRLLGGVIFF
jgi:hypothetical protein